jgi:hypothetical protein
MGRVRSGVAEGREDMRDRDARADDIADVEGTAPRADEAVLSYRGARLGLWGRALKLILWVASRQQRINETAPVAGQMWMSWKGDGPRSIDGDIKAPL